jgi:hypothetical protein
MALLSDVENALVATIAQALGFGPNYVPGSAVSSSVTRSLVRIYRGWPKSSVLNGDLASGVQRPISVFPVAGATRRTTRYHAAVARSFQRCPHPTFDAAVSGHTVYVRRQCWRRSARSSASSWARRSMPTGCSRPTLPSQWLTMFSRTVPNATASRCRL